MNDLKISVHPRCKNKNDTNVDRSVEWQAVFKSVDWLMEWVANGGAWSATHFQGGKKLKENASTSNCVVFDIDGNFSLNDFWDTALAKQWCAATYTSCSHTEESHRFRSVFPLEIELRDAAQHAAVYEVLEARLLEELQGKLVEGVPFDHSGREMCRLWYGNDRAVIQRNGDAVAIPSWFINGIEVPVNSFCREDLVPADSTDLARAVWGLSQLQPSEDGEYHEVYWRTTKGCALIGGDEIHDAWLAWVDRGHHSSKQANRRASVKWRGVHADGSVAYLFDVFNDLMPGWRDQLPEQLKFKSRACAGYDEIEPPPDFGVPAQPCSADTARGAGVSNLVDAQDFVEPLPRFDVTPSRAGVQSTAFPSGLSAVKDVPWPASLTVHPCYVVPEFRQINREFLQWLDQQRPVPVRNRRR